MEQESRNQNLHLLALIFFAGLVFTLVIGLITYMNVMWGMIFAFLTVVGIILFTMTEVIKQKYDLLLSSPAPGQSVTPFVIKAFGKELWKYPKEGAFVFTPPAQPDTPGDYDPMNPPKKKKYRNDAKAIAREFWEKENQGFITRKHFAKHKGISEKTLYTYLKDFPREFFPDL